MIRKLLIGISAAAMVAVLYPATADAAQTGTVVFTAGAEVCHPGTSGTCADGTPADFWAPVAPQSNCTTQPGLCDDPGSVRYEFSTTIEGHGGQKFCAGVAHQDGVTEVDDGVNSSCALSSEGTVDAGPLALGPYCGYSSGKGISQGNVGQIDLEDVGVEWVAAAGGVLPLILTDESPSGNGDIIGTGAVATSGAQPGTCGLDPSTSFEPTNTFAVTGYANVNKA